MEEKIRMICESFRQKGGRLTEQRADLIRIIYSNPASTAKELFYLAKGQNKKISSATVYRTLNSLVQMGYISDRHINCKAVSVS